MATRRGLAFACSYVFVVGLPLLGLEVRILVVCRIIVRTAVMLGGSNFEGHSRRLTS